MKTTHLVPALSLVSFAALVVLLAGPSPVAAAPVELLTNGSFESPVTGGFGPTPTNWSIGPPEPSAVNYPWLQPIWSLVGANPDGSQIASLNGNCRQTVGTLQADKIYTISLWVYFRSNQQFYADLTTTPYSGGLVRFINDGPTIQNMPNPVPLNQWINLTAMVNTSLPVYAAQVGQPLYVHLWSTGSPNEILADQVSLLVDDAPPLVATNYYVSVSEGNNANDGLTPVTPWQDFANLAPLTLAPGDSVNLKRGDTWAASKLTLAGKGTALDPIRLTAYGDGLNPVITGINRTTEPAVVINNASHWVIDSLDLRDAKIGLYLRYTGGNLDGTGEMFGNQDVTVSHCNFQGMDEVWSDVNGNINVVSPYDLSWGAGIWVGGAVPSPPGGPWASTSTTILDGLTVRYCSFQDTSTGVGTNWYFPPKFKGRLKNVLLEDLWVTGCENGSTALFHVEGGAQRRVDTWMGGDGFYATGTTAGFLETMKDFTIEDCEFAFNKRNATANDGVGFDFEGDTENVIFRHNVLHDNDGAGILVLPTQGANVNLQMLSNTLWNNARHPKDSSQNRELIAASGSGSGNFSNNGVYLGTDTIGSGFAIYNNQTRWNTNYSANTGGNRTATSWAAVSARPTEWNFTASTESWGGQNDWAGFAASGGALVGTSGADAYAESAATWVNTRERRWLLVTMSQTVGTVGQVFFQTETFPTWTVGKSVSFPIVADGALRSYVVDLSTCAEYRGVATKWRLDPTNSSGSAMAIDQVSSRIDPFVESVMAVSPTEVDVAFNMAMLPAGGVFAPANYALGGAGKGSLATNPSSVSQLPTAGGPVYRLKWNSGGATGAAATLTVTNAQNARGHAIGSVPVASTVTFTTLPAPVTESDGIRVY